MPYDNSRPFDFADLAGRPEPESWGPRYSKPSKPGKAPVDRFPINCASGQRYEFDAAKHRAKLRAEFRAQAEADRRNWAMGKPRLTAWQAKETIIEAYKAAMRAKRDREAALLDRAA